MKIKCWKCGELLEVEETKERVFCDKCKSEKSEKAKEDFEKYWELKNSMTLERAIKRIEADNTGNQTIYDFKESIEAVAEYVKENPRKLESTEEYIALIIMLSHRTKIKCQYKIEDYRVDFLLPELKVILEIDGYNHNKARDAKRDLIILHNIGRDYEIVRIPTKYVNSNPKKLYDAIIEYRNTKRRYRKLHNAEFEEEIANVIATRKREKENREIASQYRGRYLYMNTYTDSKKD
jgi:very-short-patch-repair endonuclease